MAAKSTLQLKPEDRATIEQRIEECESLGLRKRLQALKLVDAGFSARAAADLLDLSSVCVQRILRDYEAGGMDIIYARPTKPRIVKRHHLDALAEVVAPARSQGWYWSIGRMAGWLEAKYGFSLSAAQLRSVLACRRPDLLPKTEAAK